MYPRMGWNGDRIVLGWLLSSSAGGLVAKLARLEGRAFGHG